jgi:maleylacetate reductase
MPGAPRTFVHTTRALRVVFEEGATATAGEELDRLGVGRALLITTPRGAREAGELRSVLGARLAGTFEGAELHVPVGVARAAVAEARRMHADVLVAVGGGSAIGAAKAAALETGLPIVALPTTYSGSEMTSVWGISEEERKRTGRDGRVAPRVVIYDPLATLSLPAATSAESGMNAIAHAVEALYAPDRSPLSGLLAEEGIRALAATLPQVVRDPSDRTARSEALYGAHLAGWALDLASMGLHHKLCHVLGGTFGLPHARVHALLLPHVAAFNAEAAPRAMARIARALGVEGGAGAEGAEGAEARGAPAGLAALNRSLGITATLADLGLGEDDLDLATELAVRQSYPNPRSVERDGVRALLRQAWEGGVPSSR